MRDTIVNVVGIIMIVSVAALILGGVFYSLYLDAQADARYRMELRFDVGDIVDLKIGGKGQVIKRNYTRTDEPYLIRILTEDGFDERWVQKVEIK
jgi:hypothetical protein